jgi:hypothetical protein
VLEIVTGGGRGSAVWPLGIDRAERASAILRLSPALIAAASPIAFRADALIPRFLGVSFAAEAFLTVLVEQDSASKPLSQLESRLISPSPFWHPPPSGASGM